MFLSVELKDFMGTNVKVEMRNATVLSGRNGSHKTTVLHALAFGLCGTDAWGTPAPVFMISNDMDKMTVIIKTDKSTIQRSLTRGKTHSIKLHLNDMWVNVNQTQMAEMVGPVKHILSVLNPKFFFSMTQPRQLELLSSLIPEEDRVELVQQISGVVLQNTGADHRDKKTIREKAPLRAAEMFALRRREAENRISYRDSSLEGIGNRKTEIEKEMASGGYASPDDQNELEFLERRQTEYKHALDMHHHATAAARAQRDKSEARKKELEQQLRDCSQERSIFTKRIEELRLKLEVCSEQLDRMDCDIGEVCGERDAFIKEHEPKAPQALSLPSKDHCSSCGQPVSKRYRDKVVSENAAAAAKYEEARKAFDEELGAMAVKVSKMQELWEAARETLREMEDGMRNLKEGKSRLDVKLSHLEKDLERLKMEVIPEQPVPEKNYSEQRLKELRAKMAGLKPASAMTSLADRLNELDMEESRVRRDHAGADELAERYHKLESACKRVPEREMQRTKSLFKYPGYSIDPEVKDLVVCEDDTPYHAMSAGQKMKAEALLSLHINTLLEKKAGVVFLDDFELVDSENAIAIGRQIMDSGVQIIRTKVTNDEFRSEAR